MIGNDQVYKVNELYDMGRYGEAYAYLCQLRPLNINDDFKSLYIFVTLLIDVSDAGKIKEGALEAYDLMCKFNKEFFCIIERSSVEYSWGNAAKAFFDIQRAKDPNFLRPELCSLLVEAKNHYWRAYKESGPCDEELKNRIITNLAITLSVCGRVTESLIYYKEVLSSNPCFSKALMARGLDLYWLKTLSGGISVQQVIVIKTDFENALKCGDLLLYSEQLAKKRVKFCDDFLKKESPGLDLVAEAIRTREEFKDHTEDRRFYLLNDLALSEHSTYCHCMGARRDNLSIAVTYKSIHGAFVSRHEQILNRLKCEFGHARNLYYLAKVKPSDFFESQNYDMCLTELFENEVSGSRSEYLRSAFKSCFSILDKIAVGLCDLYAFEVRLKENIYFHSFWKNNKRRWSEINLANNYPLFSLYHQAQDLNSTTGEWSFYRDWRNALEHGSFALFRTKDTYDPLGAFDSNFKVLKVEYDYFENQVLKLLQFTRSAIFSYVFCVRGEASIESSVEDNTSTKIALRKKEFCKKA
jgi:hypothetical protein